MFVVVMAGVIAGGGGRVFEGAQTPAPGHDVTLAYNRALGVSCEHCHVADRWKEDAKPAFRTALGMSHDGLEGSDETADETDPEDALDVRRVPEVHA
jgi:hypothetical protein